MMLGIDYYITRGEMQISELAKSREAMRLKKFDTIAVHGLYNAQEALKNGHGSIMEPLMMTPAQQFENSDHLESALAYQIPAWAYSRIANPTLAYLEETLALLEGYDYEGEVSAAVYASGMSAIFMATYPLLQANQSSKTVNIVVSTKCYGGTFMLFSERYSKEMGIEVRWVKETQELEEWESNIDENTRFLYGEMPSNPSLDVIDIAALAQLAHQFEIPLIVDSTLSTPALCRPLSFGADIVVHSLSKSIGSSGLAIAGALIAKHDLCCRNASSEVRENFAQYCKLYPGRDFGPSLSPMNAFMILNDLRTLRSRMDNLSRNAELIISFLLNHPAVDKLFYPGLSSSGADELVKNQMQLVDALDVDKQPINRYGHVLSFTVGQCSDAAREVFDQLKMIWRATDLGRIKSTATIPAISTHQQQGDEGRQLADIPTNLIRLSIGNENPKDIIDDLQQALASQY